MPPTKHLQTETYPPIVQRLLDAEAKKKRREDAQWLIGVLDALPPHGTEADYVTDDPEAA